MTIKTFMSGKAFANSGFVALALLLSVVSAHAQNYEIIPLVGARFGGTIKVGQPENSNFTADLADSLSFGVVAGYRFGQDDGFGVIGFRWMREDTHLTPNQGPLVINPLALPQFRPSITLDHYLVDFSHEFTTDEEFHTLQPYISVSLGAARMGAPAASSVRFAFGFGSGLKVFPSKHYGFRLGVDYMPVVMNAELQRLVCVGGACTFALSGGVMNQFEVSLGPAFRF